MSALTTPATRDFEPATTAGAGAASSAGVALASLAVLWALQTPLFLASPITNDAAVYDIQARHALAGGVLYRDLFETNLPGAIWIHMLVRSVAGWSGLALRAFDLILFATTCGLVGWHLKRAGATSRAAAWTVAAVSAFYFSSSEWIHCQRDIWMLAPALGALALRTRQVARWSEPDSSRRVLLAALLEGAVWGLAVWIKPHVLLPAAVAWIVSATRRPGARRLALDFAGLLAGGVAVGALGVAWLVAHDAWPHLVATLRDWNPRYVRAGREHWTRGRFVAMNMRMFPWTLVHLAALAGAAWLVRRAWRRPARAESGVAIPAAANSATLGDETLNRALLAAFYVAWTLQVFLVQHLFDYVHAAPIVLGLVVVAAALAASTRRIWSLLAVGALALTVLFGPLLRLDRLAAWPEAVRSGATPELNDRLRRLAVPEWESLERVAQYLEGQEIGPKDVLCVSDGLVHLYARLGARPPFHMIYVEQSYFLFPDVRDGLREAVRTTPHRFVVVNLIEAGFTPREAHEGAGEDPPTAPPALNTRLKGAYPWNLPVAYRDGSYVVFRVEEPKGTLKLPAPRRKAS